MVIYLLYRLPRLLIVILGSKTIIQLKRLSEFINGVVAKRKLSPADTSSKNLVHPHVVMKMDIEGTEVNVVPDLVMSGALQHVDLVMTEWHHGNFAGEKRNHSKRADEVMRGLAKVVDETYHEEKLYRRIKVITMDDETYFNSTFPLPKC